MIEALVRIDDDRDDRFQLLRLHWEGAITGLRAGIAELIVTDHVSVDPDDLVGRRIAVDFGERAENRSGSTPSSVIRSVVQDHDLSNGRQILRVDLQPVFAELATEESCCTYGDKTVQAIISEVLKRNGFVAGRDFEFRVADDAYEALPFVAQFDESDLAFVHRLCEHWGLSTGLESRPGAPDMMVFADDPRAFVAIPLETLPYRDSGYRFGVTRLTREVNAVPAEVVLQNYVHDWPERPLQVVQRVAFGKKGRQLVHDHDFRTTDRDGRLLARIRAEELSCRRVVYEGEATAVVMRAGQLCTITGHPVWGDVKLLVTSMVIEFENAPLMRGAAEIPVLTERFTAMPLDLDGVPMHYRPERRAAKPRIHGVLHGMVEASEDRLNSTIDETGCYRVQLLNHGGDGGTAALYPRVRMAQPVGGAGAGMHFPIHPGTEVLLAFVDGDPDRPFICGTVPNPRDRSVVDERTATKNLLMTAAGSRLEFDDGALAAGDGGTVTGDAITGKLHVPYDDSRTGGYLRMGRADDREAAESRAPAAAEAVDGWYDFVNGPRTSVTMGESVLVRGGKTTERHYGGHFRIAYPSALVPLSRSSSASGQAGLGSAGTGSGQATQADSTGSETADPANTVSGSYDGVFGTHDVTVTASNTSSYTRGSAYSYTGGWDSSTTAGASIAHTAGLAFSTMMGIKVSYELSASISYTYSGRYEVADGPDYGLTRSKTEVASERIELSVRAPTNAESQLRSQAVLRAAAAVTLVADLAREDVVGTVLAYLDDAEAVETMDHDLSIARTTLLSVSVLAAIVSAIAIVGLAKSKAANLVGTGPRLTLVPDRGSLMAGSEVVPAEVAVTPAGAMVRLGDPDLGGSLVATVDGEVVLRAGPATFIKLTRESIEMSAGGASMEISNGAIMANAEFRQFPPMPVVLVAPPVRVPPPAAPPPAP